MTKACGVFSNRVLLPISGRQPTAVVIACTLWGSWASLTNSVLPLMLALALYFSVYQYFTKTEKCTGMHVQTKMFSWKSTAVQLTGGFHKINLSKCSHRYIIPHLPQPFLYNVENNLHTSIELT